MVGKEQLKENAMNLTDEELLSFVEDFKTGMSVGELKRKYNASPKLVMKRAKQLLKTI